VEVAIKIIFYRENSENYLFNVVELLTLLRNKSVYGKVATIRTGLIGYKTGVPRELELPQGRCIVSLW